MYIYIYVYIYIYIEEEVANGAGRHIGRNTIEEIRNITRIQTSTAIELVSGTLLKAPAYKALANIRRHAIAECGEGSSNALSMAL